jgi:hypothetical protein
MISRRDRRAVLLGVVAIAVAAIGKHAKPTYEDYTQRLTALRLRRELLSRTQDDVRNRSQLEQTATQLQRSLDSLSRRLLRDTVAADAEESLIESVDARLSEHEVRVVELAPALDDQRAGSLARVSVRLTVESDLEGIVDALLGVEADSSASLVSIRIMAPETMGTEPPVEVLRAEATIAAWYRAAPVGPR